MSAITIDNISNRSTDQIFITGDDIKIIKTEMIAKYKLGYRVVTAISQSQIQVSISNTKLQKGEILIVMEK